MNALHTYSRALFFTILLGLLATPGALLAQNQTNDPLVDDQQYLFDVHRVNQAWSYTTGSSSVNVGIYSMLGFTQNHEDLSDSRLKAPVGSLLKPELDVASQMVGILGATTNNGVGMAGIDRGARLQSYSALRSAPKCPTGCDEEEKLTINRPNGTTETYYLNLYQFGDIVSQGRNNGADVHLFSFGLPSPFPLDYDIPEPGDSIPVELPNVSGTPSLWDIVKDVAEPAFKRANSASLCGDPFGIPLTWLLGDCTSRPNPYKQFSQRLSAAVANDGAAVVGPAGDLNADGDLPIGFNPGLRDRYSIAVGGLEYQNGVGSEPIAWSRTRPAPYIDVAAFAKDVVGLSGAGSSQYDTDFTSTAASASIGAGVASLLKAEMPVLTGEDIDQILKRTARDAGAPGQDDATGAGAIDANSALAYLRNNDVQRTTQTVGWIISDKVVNSNVELKGTGYWDYAGPSCGTGPRRLVVEADLHKFKANVPFAQTFRQGPDAWVRWGQSNGYESIAGENAPKAFFAPYQQGLRVVETDGRNLVVEGYYWDAEFRTRIGQRCATLDIPKPPKDFKVAYTAVGTEGPPPPQITLSGPPALDSGETGTWTASVSGGIGSTSYDWEYRPAGSNTWYTLNCSGSDCSTNFFNDEELDQTGGVRAIVTKGSETDGAEAVVTVKPASCLSGTCMVARGPGAAVQPPEVTRTTGHSAALQWTASRALPADRFVVEHRADTTGAWSQIGTVATADSVGADSTAGRTYRFTAEDLDVGPHQFRLAVRPGEKAGSKQTSGPVTARVELAEAYRLSTYPNPVRERATLELAVKKEQDVTVAVYDVLGRRVTTLMDGRLPAQETERLSLNASRAGLSSGTYFVRVQGEGFVATERLTVVQ